MDKTGETQIWIQFGNFGFDTGSVLLLLARDQGTQFIQPLHRADSLPVLDVGAVQVVQVGEHGDDEVAVSIEPDGGCRDC